MKNLIKYIFFFTLVLVFISCSDDEKGFPKNIIPQSKMVEIITEVELTQALIKLKTANRNSHVEPEMVASISNDFNQIFDDFNVSEEQFNNSLTYYSEQPKVLEEMYAEVVNKLSEKQAAYQ